MKFLNEFKARHHLETSAESLSALEYRHCERHGRYQVAERQSDGSLRPVTSKCPHCQVEEAQRARLALTPKRYRNAHLTTSTATPAQDVTAEVLQRMLREPATNLWLYGPAGTGKTHLGHALCDALVAQGNKASVHSLRAVLNQIRATWKPGSTQRAEDIIRQFAQIPVLILDELDKVRWSENTQQLVFALLDMRYLAELPTVCISNQSPESLRSSLSEPVWDRLQERLMTMATGNTSVRGQDIRETCNKDAQVALYERNRENGDVAYEKLSGTVTEKSVPEAVRSRADFSRSGRNPPGIHATGDQSNGKVTPRVSPKTGRKITVSPAEGHPPTALGHN